MRRPYISKTVFTTLFAILGFWVIKAHIAAQRGKKISEQASALLLEYADNLIRQLYNRLPAGETC